MADAKGQTMLAIERKNEILQKLRAEQRVLVSELAAHYQVTEETIRRDLDKLEKEGYATKTYGGAILGNSTKTDLSHAIRSKTNVEFKNQIADLVCQMVDDGDHLMIDDSSTALFCAKKLRDKKNLTIITNSVELVVELANVETWSILLTGGRLKAESLALVGSQCEKYLGNYHVDKVFVSCKGLDREAGVTDSNELNAQAKQAMLRAGRQKILVVDSSKIDKVSFVNITPVSGIEAVVTNARPSEAGCATWKIRACAASIRRIKQNQLKQAAIAQIAACLFFCLPDTRKTTPGNPGAVFCNLFHLSKRCCDFKVSVIIMPVFCRRSIPSSS